jgi:hypothetical protein
MAAVCLVAGAAFRLVVAPVAGSYFDDLKMPGSIRWSLVPPKTVH